MDNCALGQSVFGKDIYEIVKGQPRELIIELEKQCQTDKATFFHSLGVAKLAFEVAHSLNFSDKDCRLLTLAALYHDIGKNFIDKSLINKAGSLTKKEKEIIGRHVEMGVKTVSSYDESVAGIIACHHDFKKESKKSHRSSDRSSQKYRKLGKILAIIDVFRALKENRPYKSALPTEEAERRIGEELELDGNDKKIIQILKDLAESVG